jgi:uncharacterized protein (DUF1684 family)
MPETIEIVILVVSLCAAGAAIWAGMTSRAVLQEQRRQTQITLHVELTVAQPGGELRLFVQNTGRVAATVTHVAVQIDTPRLQGEHRERLESPMRLTLAWQLAPARSTEITMVPLPDLAEALLSISISRVDLIGLAWDQDGTLHRSEPMPIKAVEWRERGKVARMSAAELPAEDDAESMESDSYEQIVDDAEPMAPVEDDAEPMETVEDDTIPLEREEKAPS